MKKHLSILLFLLPLSILAQETTFPIDSLPQEGILLDSGWKWHSGDNPDFARPDYDDSDWPKLNPDTEMMDLKDVMEAKTGWLRLSLQVDSSLIYRALTLMVNKQSMASEFYLNSELIAKIGVIGDNNNGTIALSPPYPTFIDLTFAGSGKQVLAVRFAIEKGLLYNYNLISRPNKFLSSKVIDSQYIKASYNAKLPNLDIFRGGLFLILFVLHLSLYWYDTSKKANLFFLVYAFLNCVSGIELFLYDNYFELSSIKMFSHLILCIFFLIGNLSFLTAVYELFQEKKQLIYWLIVISMVVLIFGSYITPDSYWANISVILIFAVVFEVIRISIKASLRKATGYRIVLFGCLSNVIFLLLYYLSVWGYLPSGYHVNVIWNVGNLSIPIAISIYLALEASNNAKNLKIKLNQVEELSKENEQILASQNQELDKQVKERTHELTESLNNLKATQAQLIQSEKMASLGELTAGIAHEIQNPLNFVNNFSEVTEELVEELEEEGNKEHGERDKGLEKELFADIKDNLTKIHHHGNRASSIVKGMLEHSRTSSGKKELTDINALADEYLRLAYHGIRAKDKSFNADFKTYFDPTLPKVEIVSQDMGRVLLNLINNAFQAVSEEGERRKQTGDSNYKPTVTISTKKNSLSSGEVVVADNGSGIPYAIKDKIFQPFFTTKDTGKGTGLGLSLAYDIVKAHGGEIKVESKEGEGTQFIITIPII